MSNSATITFTTDGSAGQLSDIFVNSNPTLAATYMQNYLSGLAGGSYSASVGVIINNGNAVAASCTAVVTSPVSGDKLLINGVAFIAGSDFVIGSDSVTTSNLANAINASANSLIAGVVHASASSNTLTISAASPGIGGNLITVESMGSNSIAVAGSGNPASATLTNASDANGDTAVINGVTLTAVDKKEKWQVATIADIGAVEVSDITAVADTGAFESRTITTVPDVADSLNSKYFTFAAKDTGGLAETSYYVWYSTGAGVDPTPGGTGIPVVILTNDGADAVATATRAAITSVAGAKVSVSGATDQVIITDLFMGNATNSGDGAAPTGFSFINVSGAASNLLNSYFIYQTLNSGGGSTNSRYVWYNVNGEGVDPAPGGTGIQVSLSSLAAADVVAASTRAALLADTKITISGGTTHIIITNKFMGVAVDTADGVAPTGFAFSKTADGTVSNLQNSYFTFYSALDATKYALWYNVNSEGVAPVVAGVSPPNLVEVDVAAGAVANDVASASRAVFLASPLSLAFTESGATDKIVFRNLSIGATTDASDAGATGFSLTNLVQGGSVSAVQFQITGSNSGDASALAALINAQASLSPIVIAKTALAVVTVTAQKEGIEGNDITISATGGISASGSRLSGGTNPGSVRLTGGVNSSSVSYSFGR